MISVDKTLFSKHLNSLTLLYKAQLLISDPAKYEQYDHSPLETDICSSFFYHCIYRQINCRYCYSDKSMEYESGGRNLNTVSVIAIPDARPVAVTIYPYLNTASVIVILEP